MWKKTAALGISFILLGSTMACSTPTSEKSLSNQESVSHKKDNMIKISSAGMADVDFYSSFAEVEEKAPIIIEATRVGNPTQNTSTGDDGTVLDTWQVTEVEVNQVHKGDIEPNSVIKIAEPGYYDENGTYVSYEGYKLMENDNHYLLALRPNTENDEYIIIGLFQGKFNLDQQNVEKKITSNEISQQQFDEADYVGENETQFNKLKQEVLAKYAN